MRDEQVREAEPGLEILEESEDLSPARSVERRDGLVQYQKLGMGGERAGDADALSLSAAERAREPVRMLSSEAYEL